MIWQPKQQSAGAITLLDSDDIFPYKKNLKKCAHTHKHTQTPTHAQNCGEQVQER